MTAFVCAFVFVFVTLLASARLDLTDFLRSNTLRSKELGAKIDQLEEDIVVACFHQNVVEK